LCNFLYETPLAQIKEKEMKKIISILLILTQTSILFADTLTFKNGVTIQGKLVRYNKDRLTFKVDEDSMRNIPQEAVITIVNDNTIQFHNKYVKNVKDENNNIIANPAGERLKKGLMVAGFSCTCVAISVAIIGVFSLRSLFNP
jgi:hypothetical protein